MSNQQDNSSQKGVRPCPASWERIRKSLGERVLLMGILNVTPDSFSDGGQFVSTDEAIAHAIDLVSEGADIIDIGGESTRPGAKPVTIQEEMGRVLPVIEQLSRELDVALSVDTSKGHVAREALKAGACLVNDVCGLRRDASLGEAVAACGAGLVLMHSRGTPEEMQNLLHYDDLWVEIKQELGDSVQRALSCGVKQEQIIVDPGIGFAKTVAHNYQIVAQLSELVDLGYPILIGPSRKSFIGKLLDKGASERLFGTAAAVTASVLNGADIVRVHDVGEMADVVRVAEQVRKFKFE